ncbi:MAG: hypothetical protein JW788_02820 [Candidatus Omnitrophica bacterium]|nr:hypothetical protein [Candidatus Omnitrophota bacterium]
MLSCRSKYIFFLCIGSLAITVFSLEAAQIKKMDYDKIFSQYKDRGVIKVEFFRLDKTTGEKTMPLGFAELNADKLTVNTEDPRLERLLKGDFNTAVAAKEKDRFVEKILTYKPGTVEHLHNVLTHCKDIGCIGEIIN